MDRQRRYQWLFGVFVRGIGAARYTRASAPIVAGMALCVAGVTANQLPSADTIAEAQRGGAQGAARGLALAHPALHPAAARDFAAPAVAFAAGAGVPTALARTLWLFSRTRF